MKVRHRLAILFGVVSVVLGTIAVRSYLALERLSGPLDEDPALRDDLKDAGIDLGTLGPETRERFLTAVRAPGSRFGGLPAAFERLAADGIFLTRPVTRDMEIAQEVDTPGSHGYGNDPIVAIVVPWTIVADVVEKVEGERIKRSDAARMRFAITFPATVASLLAVLLMGTGWYRALSPRWSVPVVAVGALVAGLATRATDPEPAVILLILGAAASVGWLLWFFRHRIK